MVKSKIAPQIDYQKLSSDLEAVIARLQDEKTSIDESLKLYEQATKMVEELSDYLKTAENRLSSLVQKVSEEK
jgi:exodeoxyribonuclease VII small subunit